MPYTLIIRDEANEELAKAYLYYEQVQKGLGERFLSETSELFNAISETQSILDLLKTKRLLGM